MDVSKYKKALQIVKKGGTQAAACKEHGISPTSFSKWKLANYPDERKRDFKGKKQKDPATVENKLKKDRTAEVKIESVKKGGTLSVIVLQGSPNLIAKTIKDLF